MNFDVDGPNLNQSCSSNAGSSVAPRGTSSEQEFDLISLLLKEQQTLTAIDQFAKQYDANQLPVQSRYYADLIPSAIPDQKSVV